MAYWYWSLCNRHVMNMCYHTCVLDDFKMFHYNNECAVQASRSGASDSIKSLRKTNEELQRRCADGKHCVSLLMISPCGSFPPWCYFILRWIYTQGIPL